MRQSIFSRLSLKADLNKSKFFIYSTTSLILLASALILSGCSGSKKHAAFKGTGSPYYKGSGPMPKGGGRWKIGTPYKIAGKKYYPKVNTSYDKTGTASWYGPKFHRRKTANGEWFNMHDLTAAHPTLPMPIFAKVTNLENGRHIVVRINDRGPYAHKREIDLSKASASALGIIARGTGKVRVQYLGKAPLDGRLFAEMSRKEQHMLLARIDDKHKQFASNNPGEDEAQEQGIEITQNNKANKKASFDSDIPQEKIYVQAASFSSQSHAAKAKSQLSHSTSGVARDSLKIAKADIQGRTWYRLRMGPFKNTREAQTALKQVQTAGHDNAIIVGN